MYIYDYLQQNWKFFLRHWEDHSSAVHTHLELRKQVIHSKCPNDQSFHLLVWLPTQSQSVWYSVQPKQFRWNKIRKKTLANSKDSADLSACAACYCLGYSGPFVWDMSLKSIAPEGLGGSQTGTRQVLHMDLTNLRHFLSTTNYIP